MRESEVLICFRPSGKEAYVLPGTRLVEAAAEAGIVLEVPCGGEGLCGKCRVIVLPRQAGFQPRNLEGVLIAGKFGNFIRRSEHIDFSLDKDFNSVFAETI